MLRLQGITGKLRERKKYFKADAKGKAEALSIPAIVTIGKRK